LTVTAAVLARLLDEADRAAPDECCGLLLGGETITDVLPADNVAADRRCHFEIDPIVLLSAHKAARHGGPAVLGYYHSHPTGSLEPSLTDRAEAFGDGRVWAIVAAGEVAFWRADPGRFEALPYRVAEG
jgi:proteasome lid subunit RPN8/RPN11